MGEHGVTQGPIEVVVSTGPEGWIAAIAAAGSAFFAAWQLWRTRKDANLRTTLDLLLRLEERHQRAVQHTAAVAHSDILAYYRREVPELTEAAKDYLALFNSLDMVALAVKKDIADDAMVRDWVCTIVESEMVTRTVIEEFREACGYPQSFEDLYELLGKHEYKGQRIASPRGSRTNPDTAP